MRTIQVVKRDDGKGSNLDAYVTASCVPKLEVGEIFEIKGSDVHDGIYIVNPDAAKKYASDVCKNCPFRKVPSPGTNLWPYCGMFIRYRSGNSHSICIVDARRYWPRLVIRKLSDIMEGL